MAQYLCIIRGGDDKLAELSESERNSHMQDWFAWVEKLTKDGSYQEGNPLDASHKIMRKKVLRLFLMALTQKVKKLSAVI